MARFFILPQAIKRFLIVQPVSQIPFKGDWGCCPNKQICEDCPKGKIEKMSEPVQVYTACQFCTEFNTKAARTVCPDVPEKVHPHLWRHTRAMHLYQHGMDLTLISQWLGHRQFTTTLVYAHADTEAKRKAIEKAMWNDSICSESAYESNNEEKLKRLYGLK